MIVSKAPVVVVQLTLSPVHLNISMDHVQQADSAGYLPN